MITPSHRPGSRERMLEATIDLLRGWGLAGAGINDIVRASGAPKGSVYHHFPGGKLQIANEALALYAGRAHVFISEALASRSVPADKVRVLFDAFARRVEAADYQRSCPVGTVSLDLGEDIESVRAVLAEALQAWMQEIAIQIDLGSAERTWAFAGLVMTAIEGAYVRCRIERSSQPFREAGRWLATLAV
jgi:TetR/AcrR family transcriptional repressor of lmrAB and yxaGH operons